MINPIRLSLALACLLLAACAAPPPAEPLFALEPNYQYTYGGMLKTGDVLEVRVEGLSATERLHLNRCGLPDCETTEVIATWEAKHFADAPAVQETIDTDAEYYLWVEDSAKPKAESALKGDGEKPAADGGEVTFGGHVRVAVVAKDG
jgi:hypothetical protein